MSPDIDVMDSAGSAGARLSPAGRRPPIFVSAPDNARLRALISTKRSWLPEEVRAFLAEELDRATVLSPDSMPPDVVTMNSRVVFRRDIDGGLECRTLVYDDAASMGPATCVFTFLGAALLGVAAGSRMPYGNGHGTQSVLVVNEVPFQPEAQAKRRPRRSRRR